MIINGRRFENVAIFKERKVQRYVCVVTERYANATSFIWITPFWAQVLTSDLIENWSARFFQQIIPASMWILEEGPSPYCDPMYPVSWNQTPEVWRKLFTEGLTQGCRIELPNEQPRRTP